MKKNFYYMMFKFIILALVYMAISGCSKKKDTVNETLNSVDSISYEDTVSTGKNIKNFFEGKTDDVLAITKKLDDTLRVVNFFATWCKPCIMEIPILKSIPEKLSKKKVSVYFVSLDEPQAASEILPEFIKDYGLKNVIHWKNTSKTEVMRVFKDYGGYIPFTLIKRGSKEVWLVGSIQNDEDFFRMLTNF